ncbi:MAG: UPF0158 family protein [Myxococcota bacterium]
MATPLRIDAGDLVMAFNRSDSERATLDLETGAIAILGDDFLFDGDAQREDGEDIPSLDSSEKYAIMERFAEGHADQEVRAHLASALDGRGAFRRFRDAIERWPDVRAAWFDFEFDAVLDEARAWLDDLELDYTLFGAERAAPAPAPVPAPTKAAVPRVGLVELLLLGAPDGKTELLEGRVARVFVATSPSAARKVFADVARDLHEDAGLGWRKSFIAGKDAVEVGRFRLAVDDRRVSLDVAIDPALWERFDG